MKPSFLPPDSIGRGPGAALLGYPGGGHVAAYLAEMRGIGVEGVALFGGSELNGVRILGKGHAGVVVLVRARDGMAALKMRRVDSPRPDMRAEANLLEAANRSGVGPRLLGHTPNLLMMEYLDGTPVGRWLAGRPSGRAARRTVRRILERCRRLDLAGLDHGELVDISRHVLVGQRPEIIDFESASLSRRPANVTSAAQCLYLGGLSGITRTLCGGPPPAEAIGAMRAYKRRPGNSTFAALLETLGV